MKMEIQGARRGEQFFRAVNLHFTFSGKKYFPSLISDILVFHLTMHFFVLEEGRNKQ